MGWLEGLRPQVDDPTWERIQAFQGTRLRDAAPLSILLDQLPAGLPIHQTLTGEVDAEQAKLFQGRWQATRTLLDSIRLGLRPAGHPRARERAAVFLVALVLRAEEILADPKPRALRIRALADYYASQAAVLLHAWPGLPQPWEIEVHWQALGPGVRHGRLVGASAVGPVHVNLLHAERATLTTLDCRGLDFAATAEARGALGAVSGGFFLYSEPHIAPPCARHDPVGLLVDDGRLHTLPLLRRGALVQEGERTSISVVSLAGATLEVAGVRVRIDGVNGGQGVVLYNRAQGDRAPAAGAVLVGDAVVGHGRDIPVNGAVLTGCALPLGTVHWTGAPRAAVAGGPLLVQAGQVRVERAPEDLCGGAPPVTFSQDETFDQNLLPRMAVGLDGDGALWFCAVDGRDLDVAPGLTLHQTGRLLANLGCHTVLNLDGGSSKRMWVRGQGIVDLPATGVRVDGKGGGAARPVHTAVLVSSP